MEHHIIVIVDKCVFDQNAGKFILIILAPVIDSQIVCHRTVRIGSVSSLIQHRTIICQPQLLKLLQDLIAQRLSDSVIIVAVAVIGVRDVDAAPFAESMLLPVEFR